MSVRSLTPAGRRLMMLPPQRGAGFNYKESIMEVALLDLWLPILVSAVIVFFLNCFKIARSYTLKESPVKRSVAS